MPQIYLVFKNTLNGGIIPEIRSPCRSLLAELITVKHPVFKRRNNPVAVKAFRNPTRGIPVCGGFKYPLHNRRRSFVGYKLIFISRSFFIPIRRAGAVKPLVPFGFKHVLNLS